MDNEPSRRVKRIFVVVVLVFLHTEVKPSTRWDFVKRRITPSDGEVETETTEENNNSRPDASGSEQVEI